jgi:transcription termination factor Rho
LSDTSDATSGPTHVADDAAGARRRNGGLSGMLLPELQRLAGSLGITGTGRMRKGDLITAIQQRQGDASPRARGAVAAEEARDEVRAEVRPDGAGAASGGDRERAPAAATSGADTGGADGGNTRTADRTDSSGSVDSGGAPDTAASGGARAGGESSDERPSRGGGRGEGEGRSGGQGRGDGEGRSGRGARNSNDDDGDGRRGRRNRYRDRRRGGGRPERGGEAEPQVSEDDVLIPVAGIIDVMDNYAFVRTSGYLAGANDVYVSMAQVRKYGMRRGDAVTGVVRANREGGDGRRDKYNPLVRLDTINGMDPEEARRRPEFYKLTPLYPQERLRLETEPHLLTARVIDLIMPIGKGQRALIVSPPKAGKTTVLQNIANAITTNNPECHLMVVLVDERPEEVTDMQRSVKGEVISSTFDRPPSDHTTVSELAIERAKRLVELGLDVVVLLDSITRLGRAYNNATPATGRIMSGGIDSTALYPPKRFLGAARNIENGGSLTILATALVETGSVMDTVIFEEFKATGNAELKLDRKIADKRVFPAIDIDQSSTRKEELLLAPDELGIIYKLRKVLHSLESQAALDLLLDKLKQNRTNVEFLMQIAKTTPGD